MGKSVEEIIEEAIYIATITGRRVTCTATPPDWSHHQTIEGLESAFLAEVQRLIGIYGEPVTETAFRKIIPDFDQQSPVATFDLDKPTVPVESEEDPLMERTLYEGLITKAGKFFRNLLKGGGKKPAAKAGTKRAAAAAAGGAGLGLGGAAAVGVGTGLVGNIATSFIDKDVDLANISTTDKLGITIERGSAPWLEALITRTNELLQNLTDLLGQSQPALAQGIVGLDTSIDDLIAAETGQSTGQVQSQQAMFHGTKGRIAQPSKGKRATEKSKEKDTKET